MYHGACDVLNIHYRLDSNRPVGLEGTRRHTFGHVGLGIANVDLTTGDIILATIERGRSSETRDRVFGGCVRCRVRPRNIGRDGTVVDYAAASRPLVLHNPECFLGAQKGTSQVDIHDRLPLLEGQVLKGQARGTNTRVVEQHVEPTEGIKGCLKEGPNRGRVAHVCGHDEGAGVYWRGGRSLLEGRLPAPGQGNSIPVFRQCARGGSTNSTTSPCNDSDLVKPIP